MKYILTTCAAVLLVAVSGFAVQEETQDAETAIKAACLDYIEGWFTGDAARMERALSPELAKCMVNKMPNGREFLQRAPYIGMVEWTRMGVGKADPATQEIAVEILDIDGNIASAKITNKQFIDLAHLGYINGEWKIINVLWRPAQPKKQE